MPPRKQKITLPRKSGREVNKPRKRQSTMPAVKPTEEKLVITLKLNPNAFKDPSSPIYKYNSDQKGEPDLENVLVEKSIEIKMLPDAEKVEIRRGQRQRTKAHQPDTVFGSEMDILITSSVAMGKVEDERDVEIQSSPPTILDLRAPTCNESSDTTQAADSPPPRYGGPISEGASYVLRALQSSANVQVDLPNMLASNGADEITPYTAKHLTYLYIQCYENQLWHFCDLVADTWIRALQTANNHTQGADDATGRMWRKNAALEKIFAKKKKGFKEDVFEFSLDVEDPELAADVTVINPERLQDLFAHTKPKCGARLLWADAMALSGKKIEHEIARQPAAWPEGLFFDIMCTSLRMVGRKLTLKIEEMYEGAWCRYHEHGRHGLPCYRKLAWEQKERDGGLEDKDSEASVETSLDKSKSRKRAHQMEDEREQNDAKRVRFDSAAESGAEVIDFGNLDAERESEEE